MAAGTPVSGLWLVLEYEYLRTPALLDNLGHDAGALHLRRADLNVAVVSDEQYVLKLDGGADIAGQLVDVDQLIGLDPILLTTGPDYCVDLIPPAGKPNRTPIFDSTGRAYLVSTSQTSGFTVEGLRSASFRAYREG